MAGELIPRDPSKQAQVAKRANWKPETSPHTESEIQPFYEVDVRESAVRPPGRLIESVIEERDGKTEIKNYFMPEVSQRDTLQVIVWEISRPWAMATWGAVSAGVWATGLYASPFGLVKIGVLAFGALFVTAPTARKALLICAAITALIAGIWLIRPQPPMPSQSTGDIVPDQPSKPELKTKHPGKAVKHVRP